MDNFKDALKILKIMREMHSASGYEDKAVYLDEIIECLEEESQLQDNYWESLTVEEKRRVAR